MHYDAIKGWSDTTARNRNATQIKFILLGCLLLLASLPGYVTSSKHCEPCPKSCTCTFFTHLDKGRCSIVCKDQSTFPGKEELPSDHSISSLNYNGNGVTDIPENYFDGGFNKLTELFLSNNKLESLPEYVFNNLEDLTKVSLHHNPWKCDCSLLWLQKWIKQNINLIVNVRDIACSSPPRLFGQNIISLTEKDFFCGDIHKKLKKNNFDIRRQRFKRTQTCFARLSKTNPFSGGCGAEDFGSCFEDPVTSDKTTVHFKQADTNIQESECKNHCRNSYTLDYFLFYTSSSNSLCFCGQQHAVCDDCNTNFNNWKDGKELCKSTSSSPKFEYLSGVSFIESYYAGIGIIQPFSTVSKANISFNISVKTVDCSLSLGDGSNPVFFTSGSVLHQYFLPGRYSVSFTTDWDQSNVNSTKTVPATVLDTPVFSQHLKTLVPANSDVAAVLQQGTNSRVQWTKTKPTGEKISGKHCETGWTAFRDKCLKQRKDITASYDDAKTNCQNDGSSNLISFIDEAEVLELASAWSLTSEHYTGAEAGTGGSYTWEPSGTTTYFTASELAGTANGQCVTVTTEGLKKKGCSAKKYFICEKAPVECSSGGVYVSLYQQCFVTETTNQVTWLDADSTCGNYPGGKLVTITSASVQTTIERLVQSSSIDVWIGLSDNSSEGYHMWQDGQSLSNGYSNWASGQPDDTTGSENCVALSQSNNWLWKDASCTTTKGYICQYNPGETVTVPKLYAGMLLSATNEDITEIPEISPNNKTSNTTLYLFNGWWFSQSGYLQSWLFNAVPQLKTTEIRFQVYRPHGIEKTPLRVLYAGCGSASISSIQFGASNCHGSAISCATGYQYCPLVRRCEHITTPCTCNSFPTLQMCQSKPVFTNMPRFELVAQTVVELPSNSHGLHQVTSSSAATVEQGDIIGIQVPESYSLPILCGAKEGVEKLWEQTYFKFNRDLWQEFSIDEFSNPETTNDAVCDVMATYTQPIVVQPPENIVHPDLADLDRDIFEVNIINSVSNLKYTGTIFGKELNNFQMIYPCNDLWCIVEQKVESTFVFMVRAKDHNVKLNISISEDTQYSFNLSCPSVTGLVCSSSAMHVQYAVVKLTINELLQNQSVHAKVYKGESQLSYDFDLSTQLRVANVTINSNKPVVYINETMTLTSNVQNGTSVNYAWVANGSSNSLSTLDSFTNTFSKKGKYIIQVSAYNYINNVTVSLPVYVITGAGFSSSLGLQLPTFAALDSEVTVSASALLNSYSLVYFQFRNNSGHEIQLKSVSNMNSSNLVKSVSFSYIFTEVGNQKVEIVLLNSETNNTLLSKAHSIEILNKITAVLVNNNATVPNTQSTGAPLTFSADLIPINNIGDVSFEYNFDDSTPKHSTQGNGVVSHAFSKPGKYNVTATVSNNISSETGNVVITILDLVSDLDLLTEKYFFVGKESNVTAILKQGTDVTFKLTDGISYNVIDQESNQILVVFNTSGNFTINTMASNALSSVSTQVNISVFAENYFQLNPIISSPYVPVNEIVTFITDIIFRDLDSLIYDWQISDGSSYSANLNISHTFNTQGIFNVTLTVSSHVNSVHQINPTRVSTIVNVIERLENLQLSSNATLLAMQKGSNVVAQLSITLSKGSDYTLTWIAEGYNVTNNDDTFLMSFHTTGEHSVQVTVCNILNCLSTNITINVYEIIEGLQLIFNGFRVQTELYHLTQIPFNLETNVTAGSDVSYFWNCTVNSNLLLSSNHSTYQTTTSYQANDYYFTIVASNPVSKKVLNVVIRLEDVIAGLSLTPNPAKQHYIVGDIVTFKSNISTGSNVEYLWSLLYPNGTSFVSSDAQSLKYSIEVKGLTSLSLHLKNHVSNTSDKIEFIAKEMVSGELQVNIPTAPYIPSKQTVIFTADITAMSNPKNLWIITRPGSFDRVNISGESLSHSFEDTGTYNITLLATQDYFLAHLYMEVSVQNIVEILKVDLLGVFDSKINVNDSFTIDIDIANNSDAAYTIDMGNGDKFFSKQFQYEYPIAGIYSINITVHNNVSSVSQVVFLTVLEKISGLHLLYCCDVPVGVGMENTFFAQVRTGTLVEYNWTVYDSQPKELVGQKISYIFQNSGNYTMSVTASNNYSQDTIWVNVVCLDNITKVELHSEPSSLRNLFYYETNGYNITFIAHVTGGKNAIITYKFLVKDGISPETTNQTGTSKVFMRAFPIGRYRVSVIADNQVSSQRAETASFSVQELLCDPPSHKLQGFRYREELKSQSFKVEVKVESCMYLTTHLWEVFGTNAKSECDMASNVDLKGITTTSPTITIPALTLHYGKYCFKLTSQYSRQGFKTSTIVTVNILPTPLQGIIAGGHIRNLPLDEAIVIDGRQSYDPDIEDDKNSALAYNWTCYEKDATISQSQKDICFLPSNNETITIPGGNWSTDVIYTIELTVSKLGRVSEKTTQRIRIKGKGVAVSVLCSSCRELNLFTVSWNQLVKLVGSCDTCGLGTVYHWQVTTIDGLETILLDDTTTTTGNDKPNLSIREGVLHNNSTYIFSLNVTTFDSETGSSALQLGPSDVPSSGQCSVDKTRVVAVNETVTIECENWKDNSQRIISQLIYHVFVEVLDDENKTKEWYPIYRGTSQITTFYMATEKMYDVVKLSVFVIDGTTVMTKAFEQYIEVVAPTLEEGISGTAYLFFLVQTNLPNLKFKNNPKELLQYIIPISLQLNAESAQSNGSPEDVTMRVAMRKEMLLYMNESFTVSAIDDVQQLAYILNLITQYTGEFPREMNSYVTVLEIMKTMTLSLKDQVSPGMTGDEFMPGQMLEVCSNLIQVILYDIRSGVSTPEHQRLIEEAHKVMENILLLKLQTQLVNESPSVYTNDLITAKAQRVWAQNIQTTYNDSMNTITFPKGLLDYMIGEEVFQTVITYSDNLIFWGSESDDMTPNSYVTNIYLTNTSGNKLLLYNLNKPIIIELAQLKSTDINPTVIRRKRDIKSGSDTRQSNDISKETINIPASTTVSSPINITANVIPDSALTMKFTGTIQGNNNVKQNVNGYNVTAYWKQGEVPTIHNYTEKIDVVLGNTQNTAALFFIPDYLASSDPNLKYYLTIVNNNTLAATVEIESFVTACQFYNESSLFWDTTGCTVTVTSSIGRSVCECTHLTMFGAAVLVPKNHFSFTLPLTVDVSPLVYILVSVITFMYLALLLLMWRLDLADRRNNSVVPLCGKDGRFKYEITVVTGRRKGAGTSAKVGLKVIGKDYKSNRYHLDKPNAFQRNCTDTVLIATNMDLGDINYIHIWHDNSGLDPDWYLSRVIIRDLQTKDRSYFLVDDWLSVNSGTGTIQREIRPADPKQICKYRALLEEELSKGMVERHCWTSLLDKPARARFTRVQRLTCIATMLYLYMFTNAMWYSNMAESELLVSQIQGEIAAGILASCMVFVVISLLSQLFKHTIPKNDIAQKSRKISTAETIEMEAWIDDVDTPVSSRHTSAISRRHHPHPGILRIPSNLSSLSSGSSPAPPAKSGMLRRTHNIHKVAPMPQKTEKETTKPPSKNAGNLWNNENIIKHWAQEMPPHHIDSRQSSAASYRYKSAKKKVSIAESADELLNEIDAMEEDLKKPKGNSRQNSILSNPSTSSIQPMKSNEPTFIREFHPRSNPSILNLSMGSLCNFDTAYPYSRDTTGFSSASAYGRSHKHSAGISECAWDKQLQEIEEGDNYDNQGAGALIPGYIPTHTIINEDDDNAMMREYTDFLDLPPPSRRQYNLPHCCKYFGYVLCGIISLGAIVFVFIYGQSFTNTVAMKWFLTCLVSVLTSFFVIEPLRVVTMAFIMAAISGSLERCEYELEIPPVIESNEKIKDTVFKPLGGYSLLRAKEEGKKVQRIKTLVIRFVMYTLFLLLVMVINYAGYPSVEYYSSAHIKDTFTGQQFNYHNDTKVFDEIRTFDDYWGWLEEVVAPGVHNYDLETEYTHGFKLGTARLRQIRSLPEEHCMTAKTLKNMNADYILTDVCYGNPSWTEDKNDYNSLWEMSTTGNETIHFYNNGDRRSYEGYMETYSGGGYIQTLGQTYAETVAIIKVLFSQNWLDRATRAVFLELSEYNVGTPVFTVTTILVEFPITGSAQPSYKIESFEMLSFITAETSPYLVCEIILLLICIYFLTMVILNIKDEKWKYFEHFWNWMELTLTALCILSVSLYIHLMVYCSANYHSYLENRDEFNNFADAAYWFNQWRYVNAALLFCLMIVIVHQLRFFKFMSKFIVAFSMASWKLVAMGFFFVAWLCIYSQLGYLWFGHLFYSLRTVGIGMVAMLSVFRGRVDFIDAMWFENSTFTFFFIVTFISLMFVFIFGVTLAVLQDSYKAAKSQMYYHSTLETQDYEMVDFMMERFKRWIGVKKEKPAFRRVKFQGLPSISSRHSSAKSTRSHGRESSVASSDYSLVDEEMVQMFNEELVKRTQETWEKVLDKLEEVIEADISEGRYTKLLESQVNTELERIKSHKHFGHMSPKQPPTSENRSNNSPFDRQRRVAQCQFSATDTQNKPVVSQPKRGSKVSPLITTTKEAEAPILVRPRLLSRVKRTDKVRPSSPFRDGMQKSSSEESILQFVDEFEQEKKVRKRSKSETRRRVNREDSFESLSSSVNDLWNV